MSRHAKVTKLSVQVICANLARHHAMSFVRKVCAEYGVSLHDVLVQNRTKTVVQARHRIWTIFRHTLDLSYPEIGAVFGVDHTTVVCAVHKREREMAAENGLALVPIQEPVSGHRDRERERSVDTQPALRLLPPQRQVDGVEASGTGRDEIDGVHRYPLSLISTDCHSGESLSKPKAECQ